MRLYQDGLAVCGPEEKIVCDLAALGVPNDRIRLKRIERGAVLEGTEDPDLLRTEYELIMNSLLAAESKGKTSPKENTHAAEFKVLLESRDRFIAKRIDSTLQPDEIGILFLGALHRAVENLPGTIKVATLSELLKAPAL